MEKDSRSRWLGDRPDDEAVALSSASPNPDFACDRSFQGLSSAANSAVSELEVNFSESVFSDEETDHSSDSDFTLPRSTQGLPADSLVFDLEVTCSESSFSDDLDRSIKLTLPRACTCLGCYHDASACLCNKCVGRLKIALKEAQNCPLGTGNFSYCLQCRALAQGMHGDHKSDCIPLDTFEGCQVAWVTKKERWSGIFTGVQSDRHWNNISGRPFFLHTPQGQRCEICADHVSNDKLYGTLIKFCTVECWAESAETTDQYKWISTFLETDFCRSGAPVDAFCTTCQCAFNTAKDGLDHEDEVEPLRIITGFMCGTASAKVTIPAGHFMARPWMCIKDLAGQERSSQNCVFRIRDEGAMRCKRCSIRLENGGGNACSLECALPHPLMLPRPLQIQVKPLGKSPAAQ